MDQTVSLSDRTPTQIASEINSIKSRADRIMLESCIEIGRRLTEAKAMIPYGEWGQWLKKEVDYSQRTANNLMRIYKEFGLKMVTSGEGLSEWQASANLGYYQAVILLGIPADEREEFLAVHDVNNMSVRELQEAVQEKKAEEEEMPLVIRQVRKKKKIPRQMVEVNDATQAASRKCDEQFARHCDNLLQEYGKLLEVLNDQSRIDTDRKEVNRKKALEIANNMVKTLTEYPPKVIFSFDVNVESI